MGDRLRSDHLIKIYFETGIDAWLPVVVYVAMLQGVAVTAVHDTIKIYDSSGLVELHVSNPLLSKTLVESFRMQTNQLELDFKTGDGN